MVQFSTRGFTETITRSIENMESRSFSFKRGTGKDISLMSIVKYWWLRGKLSEFLFCFWLCSDEEIFQRWSVPKLYPSKNANEKITALHNDFGIDLTQEGEGDLKIMCNLGEGLYEDGLMKGRLESALEMLKDGVDLDKIAKYTKLSLSIIKELAKQNKLI